MATAMNRPGSLSDPAFVTGARGGDWVESAPSSTTLASSAGSWTVCGQSAMSLRERYPDRWVAFGGQGVVAVGETLCAVLDEVERLGLGRRDVVIEHLDTNPPVLIL